MSQILPLTLYVQACKEKTRLTQGDHGAISQYHKCYNIDDSFFSLFMVVEKACYKMKIACKGK